MLNFFKKNSHSEGNTNNSNESVISSKELLNEEERIANTEEEIFTALSFHPSWNIPTEQRYVYQFLNNELQPLKPNQISLSGVELKHNEQETEYYATAFVRNSLNKGIRFEKTSLLILDETGDILARKEFNLSELGELPPRSSRPWIFTFKRQNLLVDKLPVEGWKLAFELKKKHSLDLEDSWESSLADTDKEKLKKLIEQLAPPKPGEVNFMGLSAKIGEDEDLHVTLLIRNGSTKDIELHQIPLQVEDASGEIVARGGFKLSDLKVKANTSKPWTFIFPKELLLIEKPDFSSWKASPIHQEED